MGKKEEKKAEKGEAKKEDKKAEKEAPKGPCGEKDALKAELKKLDVGKKDEYDKFMDTVYKLKEKTTACRDEKAQEKADAAMEGKDLAVPHADHHHDEKGGQTDASPYSKTAAAVKEQTTEIDQYNYGANKG